MRSLPLDALDVRVPAGRVCRIRGKFRDSAARLVDDDRCLYIYLHVILTAEGLAEWPVLPRAIVMFSDRE
jgi:hypothetical protein